MVSPFAWIGGQIRGWASNVRTFFRTVSVSDLLPPSVLSTIRFIASSFPRSLGFASGPKEQITGSIVFAVFLVVVSLSILTAVAVVFLIVTLPFGLLRLIPVVNRYWPLSPELWPLWSLEG